jgi:hypothetical protein
MGVMKSVGLIALGILLGIGGSMASSRVDAQSAPRFVPPQLGQEIQPGQPVGNIITGEDIGFQLIAPQRVGEVATGKLMIRVNGRWLPAAAATGVIPAR